MDEKLILRVSDVITKVEGKLAFVVRVKAGKCNVGDVLILERTGKEFEVSEIQKESYGLILIVSGLTFGDIMENDRIYKKGEEPENFYECLSNPTTCYYCGTRDFRGYLPEDVKDLIHKGITGMACPRCEHAITITNRILRYVTLSDSDEEAIKVLDDTIEHLNNVVEDIKQGKY